MKIDISSKLAKAGIVLKKHAPEILIVAGVTGMIVGEIMTCKATLKATAVTEAAKKSLNDISAVAEEGDDKDIKKSKALVYGRTGMELVKLYAPAIALQTASIGCIFASNDIMRKRSAALAAAYVTLDTSFKNYRKRVVDRYGAETDRQLKNGEIAVDIPLKDADGNPTGASKTATAMTADGESEYGRYFDERSTQYVNDPCYNSAFLHAQQSLANNILQAKGYLFLNDVYDMLGFERTRAGQVVGWIYDPENNKNGDNYVDFGIINTYHLGDDGEYYETIRLDFNVDGPILDMI